MACATIFPFRPFLFSFFALLHQSSLLNRVGYRPSTTATLVPGSRGCGIRLRIQGKQLVTGKLSVNVNVELDSQSAMRSQLSHLRLGGRKVWCCSDPQHRPSDEDAVNLVWHNAVAKILAMFPG